jgi:hypothetical protein
MSGGRIHHGATNLGKSGTNRDSVTGRDRERTSSGLPPKNLMGLPWRVALALQADGWVLRSEIIWEKPSCMPESARDRPTRSHEQVFLLTKQAQYFYDAEAVRETATYGRSQQGNGLYARARRSDPRDKRATLPVTNTGGDPTTGRNIRTVWRITAEAYNGLHFATFPQALVRKCILAGTSQAGCCPACGAAWVRQVERHTGEVASSNGSSFTKGKTHDARAPLAAVGQGPRTSAVSTTGFAPACPCDAGPAVPCTVFDPFAGAGTTVLVARALGRQGVGLDLSWPYLALSRQRLGLTALDAWLGTPQPSQTTEVSDLPLFGG